jgi:pilus assembly protein Flp/PilA
MYRQLREIWDDESAATAIEYAIMATGIALAIISVVSGIGVRLGTYFGQVSAGLK